MDTIRWGIMSTGNIAHSFAEGLSALSDAELIAVGSRDAYRAQVFADEFGASNAHGSYDALVNNPDVDVIYIGTPHAFHAENIMHCLHAGKHVLCEKPFTINAEEAAQCIDLAREKDLFLMEAVWMRFIPAIIEIQKVIDAGTIGTIQQIQANFSFYIPFDAEHRLFNLDLGGGALLDVGIYPISFTTLLMGMPQQVQSHARMSASGADEQCSLLFKYEAASALLSAGINGDMNNEAIIKGTEGIITVAEPFFVPETFTVQLYGKTAEEHHYPLNGNGYNYEAAAVGDAIRAGKREIDAMSLNETLATMQLMDALRAEWGLVYPQEA